MATACSPEIATGQSAQMARGLTTLALPLFSTIFDTVFYEQRYGHCCFPQPNSLGVISRVSRALPFP